MISNSRLPLGDNKYEQFKEFMDKTAFSGSTNNTGSKSKTHGPQQITSFMNRQKNIPYTKIFNDMLPFEENTYTKKEFLETYFKHATDFTLLPFLKRLSNSESYSRKEVKKEFKITIPANTNYLMVVNPYNLTSAITVFNANSAQLSFVSSLSLADRFQQYYSSHLFRLGYCCATNISKRESSTDNKLIIDSGLIGGNVPLELMDNIIQNASTRITHSQLTYDVFDPIYTSLFNSSNNVYYTTDPSNPIEDSVTYLVNSLTITALNSLDAINLPGDAIMVSNVGTATPTLNLYTIVNSTPTLISGTALAANSVIRIVPSGSVVYAALSIAGTVQLKTSKKSARSQDLIYYRIYAPNSPAILNISFRGVYDVAVSGMIRTEIGTFMEDDVEDEFASLLMEHIYKHSDIQNFTDGETINLQAGFFSDLVSKLLNKIPYIGNYLSKGFSLLDKEMKLDAYDGKKMKNLQACSECPSNLALQAILHSPNKIGVIYLVVTDVTDSISYPTNQILDTLRSYIKDDAVKQVYEIYKLKLTSNNTRVLFVEDLSDEFRNVNGPIYMDVDRSILAIAIKMTGEKKFLKGNVWVGDGNVLFDGIYVNFFRESNFPRVVSMFMEELKTLRRHKLKKSQLKNNEDPFDIVYIDGIWRIIRPISFPGSIQLPIEWRNLIAYWPAFYVDQVADKDGVLKNFGEQFDESMMFTDRKDKINLFAMNEEVEKPLTKRRNKNFKEFEPKDAKEKEKVVNINIEPNDEDMGRVKNAKFRNFRHQKMLFQNSSTYSTPYLELHNKLRAYDIYIGLDSSQKKQRALSQLTTPLLEDESFGVRYQFFPVLGEKQEDDSLACMVLSDRDLGADYSKDKVNSLEILIDNQINKDNQTDIADMIGNLYNLGASVEHVFEDKTVYISIFTKFKEQVKISYTSYMPALIACVTGAPNGQIMTGHIKSDGTFGDISADYLTRKMEIMRVRTDLVGKLILAVAWNDDIMNAFSEKYPLTASAALAIDGPGSDRKVLQISSLEHFILFCRLPMQSKGFTNQLLRTLGLLSPLQDELDKLKVAIGVMGKLVKRGTTKPDLNTVAAIFKAKTMDKNANIELPTNETITIKVNSSYRMEEDANVARTNTSTGFTMDAAFGPRNSKYIISAERVHILVRAYIAQAQARNILLSDQIKQLDRATFPVGDVWVTDGATFATTFDVFRSVESKYFPVEYRNMVANQSDNKDTLIKFSVPIESTQVEEYVRGLDSSTDVDILCSMFKKLVQLLYPETFGTGLRILYNVNQTDYQYGQSKVLILTKAKDSIVPIPPNDIDNPSRFYGYLAGALKNTKSSQEGLWKSIEKQLVYMPNVLDNNLFPEKALTVKFKGMSSFMVLKVLLLMKQLPVNLNSILAGKHEAVIDLVPGLYEQWKTLYDQVNKPFLNFSKVDDALPDLDPDQLFEIVSVFRDYLKNPPTEYAQEYQKRAIAMDKKVVGILKGELVKQKPVDNVEERVLAPRKEKRNENEMTISVPREEMNISKVPMDIININPSYMKKENVIEPEANDDDYQM